MDIIIKVLIVLTIIYLIIFKISLYRIFEKERQKGIMSLIPIYDLWMYFSFIRIPKWVSIVPPLNIIAFIASPYNLCKQFCLKRYTWGLAIVFPYIFVPYVAFSNVKDRYLEIDRKLYRTEADIDALEEKLKNQKSELEFSNNIKKDELVNIKPEVEVDKFDFKDELVEEKPEEVKQYVPDSNLKETINVKIGDDMAIDEVVNLAYYSNTSESIEMLEDDKSSKDVSKETVDNKEIDTLDTSNVTSNDKNVLKQIQDFKDVGASNVAIAFGGKEQIENAVKAKVEDLRCPRCNASIIGARGVCPGCGMKLSEIKK